MYELKKIGKVFTSKFVVTGPRLVKKNLPGRGLAEVEKHWFNGSRLCKRPTEAQPVLHACLSYWRTHSAVLQLTADTKLWRSVRSFVERALL
jgi:hypothetical protein